MGFLGFGFGLFAEKRPFGDDLFAHPLIVLCAVALAALLAIRFVFARPVPNVLSERVLLIGCFIGLGAFLIGNFVGFHIFSIR